VGKKELIMLWSYYTRQLKLLKVEYTLKTNYPALLDMVVNSTKQNIVIKDLP
tara:strand:+ start:125 stop:280 length:156 start_codon:yes stop_codon:yes gene_type:complete